MYYFFLVCIGLVAVTVAFMLLHPEADLRDRFFQKQLKFARLTILPNNRSDKALCFQHRFNGAKTFYLQWAECTLGRKAVTSKADIKVLRAGRKLSRMAVRFNFVNGHFWIERLDQAKLWLRLPSGEVGLLCKEGTDLGADLKIPFENCRDYTLLPGNTCMLTPGTTLFIGGILFRYEEGDNGYDEC